MITYHTCTNHITHRILRLINNVIKRMNEQVSYLYQPYNPSILRLINNVIKAAHAEGKWAGMCGEMAGDQTAVPLLMGMGLDEFSMSATSVLQTRSLMKRSILRKWKNCLAKL